MSDVTIIDTVETAEQNIIKALGNVSDSANSLPTLVDEKLDSFQQDMDNLSEQTKKKLEEASTAVSNAPAGTPAPFLKSISSQSTEEGVAVTFTAPSYAGFGPNGGMRIVTKGVMVRYSSVNYPKNRTDGELGFIDEDISDVSESGVLTDKAKTNTITGLTNGTTYYITAFPYTSYGAYNEAGGTTQCTKCQWTGTKGTLTVKVTQDYDYKPLGEYTATLTPSASGQPITKTQSGPATIVFSNLEAGEYTLSFTDVSSFTKPQDQSITVTAGQSKVLDLQYVFTSNLNDLSWEEIDKYAKEGLSTTIWSVGDTKNVNVNGETLTFEIVGFNHDDLSDGSGKATITFGMKHLMKTKLKMNEENTNDGSYVGSEMNTFVGTTFYNNLPIELKNVIKEVKKVTGNGGPTYQWSGTRTDNFKTWLFSEYEVSGSATNSENGEGKKYAKFTNNSTRIKKLSNGSGSASTWWLRSPNYGSPVAFCCVYNTGATNDSNASMSNGVCVGFCV